MRRMMDRFAAVTRRSRLKMRFVDQEGGSNPLAASEHSDGDGEGVIERETGDGRVQRRSAVQEAPTSEEDIEQFKGAVLNKLTLSVGKDAPNATDRDWFLATTMSLRDRVIHRWLEVDRENLARGRKY